MPRLLLGDTVPYPERYDPTLLTPIPRADNRRKLGLLGDLPFTGADIWNAYELSWLDLQGKPQVARGRFIFKHDSPNLIESKSLKLYLNSYNQESFSDMGAVRELIVADLVTASGTEVEVFLQDFHGMQELVQAPEGICLDKLDVHCELYEVQAGLLGLLDTGAPFEQAVEEVLYTDLFRSRCPVTGQPDWATVTIEYSGPPIDHASLLRYLVSYRLDEDFHENCVERIYCDIQLMCRPLRLAVEANFLRRGGLDINPVRSSNQMTDYTSFPRYNRQ